MWEFRVIPILAAKKTAQRFRLGVISSIQPRLFKKGKYLKITSIKETTTTKAKVKRITHLLVTSMRR